MLCRILTKEATRGPESKQQTSDREQSKKQIILFTRANLFSPGQNITLVCIGTAFPSLSNAIRVKNQFKEDSKTLKTTKEATKENKNDVADGHEMHMDMKCSAHCLVMMSFVFAPAAGRPNQCRKIQDPRSTVP